MKFEGIFLALEALSFEAEDGKVIPYYKLHAWTPITNTYKPLKVREQEYKQIEQSGIKFGDAFSCTVEEGASDKGKAFLKIVRWD